MRWTKQEFRRIFTFIFPNPTSHLVLAAQIQMKDVLQTSCLISIFSFHDCWMRFLLACFSKRWLLVWHVPSFPIFCNISANVPSGVTQPPPTLQTHNRCNFFHPFYLGSYGLHVRFQVSKQIKPLVEVGVLSMHVRQHLKRKAFGGMKSAMRMSFTRKRNLHTLRTARAHFQDAKIILTEAAVYPSSRENQSLFLPNKDPIQVTLVHGTGDISLSRITRNRSNHQHMTEEQRVLTASSMSNRFFECNMFIWNRRCEVTLWQKLRTTSSFDPVQW